MKNRAYGSFAFRFRVPTFLALYSLGFLAPWGHLIPAWTKGTLWLAASTVLARNGWIGLAAATLTVTIVALCCLAAGAALRVWGTAFLGSAVMRGAALHRNRIVAAGPYRYVRNPLYLGSWLLSLAVSILMPPSGALFFLLSTSAFLLFLISAEEGFLSTTGGEAYRHYLRAVPRLLPRPLPQFDKRRCPLACAPAVGRRFARRGVPHQLHGLFRGARLALQRTDPDPMLACLLRSFAGWPSVCARRERGAMRAISL